MWISKLETVHDADFNRIKFPCPNTLILLVIWIFKTEDLRNVLSAVTLQFCSQMGILAATRYNTNKNSLQVRIHKILKSVQHFLSANKVCWKEKMFKWKIILEDHQDCSNKTKCQTASQIAKAIAGQKFVQTEKLKIYQK